MTRSERGRPLSPGLKQDTTVTIGGRKPFAHHGYVNPTVYHASTILYRTAEDFIDQHHLGDTADDHPQYFYGRRGTPTSEALEEAIKAIEGPACAGVALLPSGLAAISTAILAVMNAGDHILVSDNVYRPTRTLCDSVLRRISLTRSLVWSTSLAGSRYWTT